MLAVTPNRRVPTAELGDVGPAPLHGDRGLQLVEPGEQHDELVTAVPADDVVLARRARERVGDRDEQRVTCRVPVGVVDGL